MNHLLLLRLHLHLLHHLQSLLACQSSVSSHRPHHDHDEGGSGREVTVVDSTAVDCVTVAVSVTIAADPLQCVGGGGEAEAPVRTLSLEPEPEESW